MAFRRLHHVFTHLRSTATSALTTASLRRTGSGRRARRRAGEANWDAGRYRLDGLEPRVLLTTISGFNDDVFEYRDELDQVIRIKATGNIVAELIGASVSRTDNSITLTNLPGNLNGDPVFGGLNPQVAIDDIGPIFIAGSTLGNISALASDAAGNVYAINSIVNPFFTRHQIVQLVVPQPAILGGVDGPVIGTVLLSEITVPSGVGDANQPRTVTGADVSPDGRIIFVGTAADNSLGAWSVDPNAADVGASLAFFGTLGVQPGDADDPLPQVTSIIARTNNVLLGVVNGAGGNANSQLIDINLNNPAIIAPPTPIVNDAGTAIPNIVGIEPNAETGDVLAVQAGDNARVYDVFGAGFARGLAFDLGPVGSTDLTSLSFTPNLPDPFTGRNGAYLAVNGGRLVYVDGRDRLPAQFLWNVYVSQSDLTGQLSIGYVRELDANPFPDPYVMRAFEGSIGSLRVLNAQSGDINFTVAANANTGRVLQGARTQDINPDDPNENLRPFEIADVPSDIDFGVLPDNIAALRPGLITAPGQDLGKYLLGGTFTGAVDAAGSIDFMYAGWLLTGTVGGQFDGAIERPDNFNVAGDIRNLIVLDDIGTHDPGGVTGDAPTYITGFDMRVGGTAGEVAAGGFVDIDRTDPTLGSGGGSAILGSIEVNNLPNAPRIERNQFEAEFHANGTNDGIPLGFEQFNFGGSAFTFNDTFNTAEYLGSIRSGDLGRSEVIRLNGTLQKSTATSLADGTWAPGNPRAGQPGDIADFYGVALMAGQRYVARVQGVPQGLIDLGVFDPSGRLIATDYSNTGQQFTQEQFFSFVADRPGVYRFAVGAFGDAPDFVGDGLITGVVPYTLTVVGVGDLALGGVVASGPIRDVFDPLSYDPGVEIFVGDLGAVRSYGTFLSNNTDTIVVERGNMRTIEGINVGRLNGAVVSSPPTADVPQGSVGLIRAGSPARPFDQALELELDDDQAPQILPGTGQTLFYNFGNTRPIGGDYQMIDGVEADSSVTLIADRGVGVVRVGQMAILGAPSVFTVNADDRGEDGIIDLIDVNADMGNPIDGGPAFTTNTGGNVRYVRVLGTVYRDVFFGDPLPIEFVEHQPGDTPTLIDDGGAVMRMQAIGEVRRSPAFDPQFPQSGIDEFVGPELTITAYGVRDHGGSIILDVSSTGGLEIDVSGARSAEIGRVEIQGVGVEVLNGPDVDDPDSPLGTRETFVTVPGTVVPNDPDTGEPPDDAGAGSSLLRRARPEDLSLFLRGSDGATVDVLNVVVLDTGEDNDADTDPTTDEADADEDGNFTEVLDADGDGFADEPGNDNEISEAGFYLGALTEGLATPVQFGNAVRIINETDGEIVNLLAESVVELAAGGSLGMARNHTGTDLIGNEILHADSTLRGIPGGRALREVQPGGAVDAGSFGPLLGETNAIQLLGGSALEIRAGKAIGNVIVQGSIVNITANADGRDDPGVFEGIAGVVGTFSFTGVDQPVASGRLVNVRIGEGIAFGGSGNFADAGVFAHDSIRSVTGSNADIRGDVQTMNGITVAGVQEVENPRLQRVGRIVVESTDTTTTTTVTSIDRPRGIETVRINDGSIINSDIIVSTNMQDAEEFDGVYIIPGLQDPITAPIYEIGSVTTNGNGGIIGANIQASDIGRVAANGANTFGIFSTFIGGQQLVADDVVNFIEADGYGIRGTTIIPSGTLNNLVANGDGTSLSTNAINARVRFSEQDENVDPLIGVIDPFFGTVPNPLTDIHAFLGTNKNQPEISGVTDTGVIAAVDARGQRTLGNVRAWQIRGGTNFDFANSIRSLQVRDVINGLEMTTGTLKNFRLDRDAFALSINVTGKVKKIDIRGSLAGGSVIRTKGDGGSFDSVNVSGNLIGNINSSRAIKSITIGGDFTGNVSVQSTGTAIKTMKVGGAFIGGSLDVQGGVNTLQTAGSLGSLGDTLTVNGSIKKITVGGDLRSNLRVTGDLNTLNVRGSIVDGGLPNGLLIDISGNLKSLVVGGDIQPGVTINANSIKKQKIGGQNAGTIVIQ